MEPSPPAPAPTRVCSSSMNRMISPLLAVTSLMKALRRSSNSPRYLAPASMEPMFRLTRRLPLMLSGTSPFTMRRARPSAMAVLPTPGSPMSTGLFLVRRERICSTRRISASRPMTGSILPWRARAVRSVPYFSRVWYFCSGSWSVMRWLPRTSFRASRYLALLRPQFSRMGERTPSASKMPSTKCSTLRKSSPMALCCCSAAFSTRSSSGPIPGLCATPPRCRGWRSSCCSSSRCSRAESTPARVSTALSTPPSCCTSASRSSAG